MGGTPRERTIHARSGAPAHVTANPALPRDVGTRQNRQEIHQKKLKENKMNSPSKGLLRRTVVYFSCAYGGDTGGHRKGKIRQDDWRGVELRGEMRQGEVPQSATKATPRVLHKQLALRRGEVHRRGRSKGGRRKKSDVTHYRFFASSHHLSSALPPSSPVSVAFVALLTELLLWHSHIPTPLHPFKYPTPAPATISVAWVALNRFPVFFQAEDEIADAKKARKHEEVLSRGGMTRGGFSRFTNYFAGDSEGTCGGWHHNSESVVVLPKVQWDGSLHCRCISPTIVNKINRQNFDVPSGN
ncbi:hypothetical protein B0H14DRAFT_2615037 [Mycena olivaceomarginata]|nr:hypothetical protein B0H14DRAFT_2615037 [Mycena olivaceomarginata]